MSVKKILSVICAFFLALPFCSETYAQALKPQASLKLDFLENTDFPIERYSFEDGCPQEAIDSSLSERYLDPGLRWLYRGDCGIYSAEMSEVLDQLRITVKSSGWQEVYYRKGFFSFYVAFVNPKTNKGVYLTLQNWGLKNIQTVVLWQEYFSESLIESNKYNNQLINMGSTFEFENRLPLFVNMIILDEESCLTGIASLYAIFLPIRLTSEGVVSSGCYAIPALVNEIESRLIQNMPKLGWNQFYIESIERETKIGFRNGTTTVLINIRQALNGYFYIYFFRLSANQSKS